MTVPVPPDSSPQSAEEPAGTNPWAPLDPGQGEAAVPAPATAPGPAPAGAPAPGVPYWPPYPIPAPQPRNGLGIAAMVLGIVGVALSLAVILFWLSWLPALLAVVFGAIGLGYVRKGLATNRAMALAGVILGVTGLLVSVGAGVFVVARVHEVNEERQAEADAARARFEAATKAAEERAAKERERIEAERKRIEAEQEKAAADERARRLPFGQSYTYEDGLKVATAAPEPYSPLRTVFEPPKDAKIIQVKITVVNTGSQELSLYGSGLPIVRDAKGNLVFSLIDGSERLKLLTGSLAPGQEATGVYAYALPNSAADQFSVDFTYGTGRQRKNVIWTGSPS
ncbi:hypothetical protein ACFU7Y_41540 [Kitasatospora sp. NPDC057542]|uniref:DUF4190 domain-containing protein n=1 Tax=Streptomycetaceae TaxID=2062 RepID=UPI001CCE57DE|nr:DUF4190 domain-containing protein [Streptomyces sp. LS1784]